MFWEVRLEEVTLLVLNCIRTTPVVTQPEGLRVSRTCHHTTGRTGAFGPHQNTLKKSKKGVQTGRRPVKRK